MTTNSTSSSTAITVDKNNEFDEDLESLAKILRASATTTDNKTQLIQVKNIKCTPGSSSGDNYMSVVKRVLVSGINSDNKEAELYLIVKRQIPSLSRRQLYRCNEAFSNEINAYKHVIPILQKYINYSFYPKCYFAGHDDHGELIVLEDLKSLGYQMGNRLIGLDFEHCKLVMEELANWHATSIVVKHLNNKIFMENYQKYIKELVYCPQADEFFRTVVETSIRESLHSLQLSNEDGSLTEPIRLIRDLETKLYSIIRRYITQSKERFNVICHGDLWINNIMFKRNGSTNSPNAVKFIDLQAMRYASPVFDILHFIYTSTKRDLRDAHLKKILEIYSSTLLSKLELHLQPHYRKELIALRDIYSLENISDEFYSHILYGLAACMWILPAVTFDPDNIPNLDIISDLPESSQESAVFQKLTPEYHSRMKDIVLEFYQNGFLKVNPSV